MIKAEYVWMDGVNRIRSKVRFLHSLNNNSGELETWYPEWSFDGGSTGQATAKNSDLILKPVRAYIKGGLRGDWSHNNTSIVLCEVMNADGTPHETNYRNTLAKTAEKYKDQEFWFGPEQEFNSDGGSMLIWPPADANSPEWNSYCDPHSPAVKLLDKHSSECQSWGIEIEGYNVEVAPNGQGEYQLKCGEPLKIADNLIISRFLLIRGNYVNFNPKLWEKQNGAGCHINFSTQSMREHSYITEDNISKLKTNKAIQGALIELWKTHDEHMLVYGEGNEKRMTGECETSDYNKFTWGVGDRTASVRIPPITAKEGKGYLEDRRPAANVDPYRAFNKIMQTVMSE